MEKRRLVLGVGNACAKTPDHLLSSARKASMSFQGAAAMVLWLRPGGPGLTSKGISTIRPLFEGRDLDVPRATERPEAVVLRPACGGHLRRAEEPVRAEGGLRDGGPDLAPAHRHPADIGGRDGRGELSELRGPCLNGRASRLNTRAARSSRYTGVYRRTPRKQNPLAQG